MTRSRGRTGRTPDPQRRTDARGLLYGAGAYAVWGVFPAFFPLLAPAGAGEVLAHRILWTVAIMAVVLVAVRRVGDLRTLSRRTWTLLACASALISTNWLIYIYAVTTGHVVDAALGYYINPLVSVALGVLVFGERLNRVQLAALAIATTAVGFLTVGAGRVPWLALGLACSFALYGAVKKVVDADPRVSVGVETAIGAPFAVGYLAFLHAAGLGEFTGHGAGHVALMVLCGPITAIPLLCFAAAAQRLTLVTLGLLQYLTPTMQLTWGVLVGHEPMPPARWAGFGLIWLALLIFTADGLRDRRPGTGTVLGCDDQPNAKPGRRCSR